MTITVSDFEKLCRCCLQIVVPLQSIFEYSLVMMLRDIVCIEMEENDGFPQKICHRCTLKLSSAFNYRKMTMKNYKILCDVLKNSKDVNSLQMENSKSHINENLNSETLTGNSQLNVIEMEQINMKNNNKSANKQETAIRYDVTLDKEIQSHMENDEELMYDNTFETVLRDTAKGECDNDSSLSYLDQACSEGGFLEKKTLETHIETESFEEGDNVTKERKARQIDEHTELKPNCDETSCDKSRKSSHLCSHCGKIFKWRTSLYKHLRLQDNVLEGDVDTKGVANKAELGSLSEPQQKNIHKCGTCDAIFKSSRVRNKHEKLHATARPTYNCVQCLATFNHKHSLQRHCQRKHSTNPQKHSCDHCNKTFLSAKSLKNHLRVHKVETVENLLQAVSSENNILASGLNIISMEYLCMVCKKKYDSQRELELHKCLERSYVPVTDEVDLLVFARHSPDNIYCEICRCVCNSIDELKAHFQTIHNVRYLKLLRL